MVIIGVAQLVFTGHGYSLRVIQLRVRTLMQSPNLVLVEYLLEQPSNLVLVVYLLELESEKCLKYLSRVVIAGDQMRIM